MSIVTGAISLDLIPITFEELRGNIIPDDASIVNIHVRYPDDATREQRLKSQKALHLCLQHTIRSMSFPAYTEDSIALGLDIDLAADTKSSVLSVMASGLPLPKSPSIQVEDASVDAVPDRLQQEREERGWWSVRFQQVLREMYRRDGYL
jgi:hypothetical protein